jgi:hypothetical protein
MEPGGDVSGVVMATVATDFCGWRVTGKIRELGIRTRTLDTPVNSREGGPWESNKRIRDECSVLPFLK